VGFLGERYGVRLGLLVVLGALLIGLAVSGAARPLPARAAEEQRV
jgi:hypothetical protein